MNKFCRVKKAIRRRAVYWIYKNTFFKFGQKAYIYKPLQIDNPRAISIGDNTYIAEGSWLMGTSNNKIHTATLKIGRQCSIGHYAHIIGIYNVEIKDSVLIADRVFISDCTHEYKDISKPIIKQETPPIGNVIIGEGTWIGENVCINGAKIGRHCIIGSNSVVNKDIPDFCVAVGSPAKVVKKYDFKLDKWVHVQNG